MIRLFHSRAERALDRALIQRRAARPLVQQRARKAAATAIHNAFVRDPLIRASHPASIIQQPTAPAAARADLRESVNGRLERGPHCTFEGRQRRAFSTGDCCDG